MRSISLWSSIQAVAKMSGIFILPWGKPGISWDIEAALIGPAARMSKLMDYYGSGCVARCPVSGAKIDRIVAVVCIGPPIVAAVSAGIRARHGGLIAFLLDARRKSWASNDALDSVAPSLSITLDVVRVLTGLAGLIHRKEANGIDL
jgi:hypothetical protein